MPNLRNCCVAATSLLIAAFALAQPLAEPVPEGGPVSAHVIATPSGSELGRVQLAAAPSAFITAGKQAWVVSELGLTALELGGARVHTRALLGQHREAPAPPSVASAAEAH